MTTWDVVVVGAGPGGSSAAYAAARTGASVLLLDRSAYPRWKVCGACLSPGALAALDGAGLAGLCDDLGAVPLQSLALRVAGRALRVQLEGSVALSRSVFDTALAEAAVEQGVEFWPESRASLAGLGPGVRRLRVRRGGTPIDVAARVVVDATGLGRGLSAPALRDAVVAPRSRIGLGATFDAPEYPVAERELHMVVGGTGYVGLVRVEDGTLNVAAAVDPGPLRASSPSTVVEAVLREAGLTPLPPATPPGWRGTPLLTRAGADLGAERLLRLGDAAGYVEPFTGEGMCWALSAGLAAAPLARAGARQWHRGIVTQWESYHRNRLRRAQLLCLSLSRALRHPWLARGAAHALTVAPGLARPLVRRAARGPGPLALHQV